MPHIPDWWFFTSVGLAFAGIMLAIIRSVIAGRQERTTAQALEEERFKMAVDLLQSDSMAVRIGGVYALVDIAKRHPEKYHVRVMDIFCGFLAYPPVYTDGLKRGKVDLSSIDTLRIIDAIRSRSKKQKNVEKKAGFSLEKMLVQTHFEVKNDTIIVRRMPIPKMDESASSPAPAPPRG